MRNNIFRSRNGGERFEVLGGHAALDDLGNWARDLAEKPKRLSKSEIGAFVDAHVQEKIFDLYMDGFPQMECRSIVLAELEKGKLEITEKRLKYIEKLISEAYAKE